MGGAGAIRNGYKYSNFFCKIIALSSALITYNLPKYTEDAIMPWQKRSYAERIFGIVIFLKASNG